MALKKGEDYIASLKSLKLEANVMGKIGRDLPDHPLVTPSVRAVASTFDCVYREETRDLFRAESSLSGEEINRFTHLHRSPEDLINPTLRNTWPRPRG